MDRLVLAAAILAAFGTAVARAQCPWSRNVPALHGSCACSYNLAQELTLQCAQVDFAVLVTALNEHAASQTIDLLYVHNSTVGELRDNLLSRLKVHNVQLSKCHIRTIGPRAFAGQEESLKNLNLQDNALAAVPVEALRSLKGLALLDLSGNRIASVPDDAFATLKLITLKLADNANLSLSDGSFRGLEPTLKNLNLKGTKIKSVPAGAIRHLTSLAFLDLAQNSIRSLAGGLLAGLDTLTALNMERNSLTTLEPDAFLGVNDTLSSLSLLNNLIVQFPKAGLAPLTQLRVSFIRPLRFFFSLFLFSWEISSTAFTAGRVDGRVEREGGEAKSFFYFSFLRPEGTLAVRGWPWSVSFISFSSFFFFFLLMLLARCWTWVSTSSTTCRTTPSLHRRS